MENYSLDIASMLDFIKEGETGRSTNTEIDESYVYDETSQKLILMSKDIRETKGETNEEMALRYDFLMRLLDGLSDPESVIQPLISNTLVEYGFMKPIKK